MLFSKDIPPRCLWCEKATPLSGENMLCSLRGPVDKGGSCRKYVYDPYKRIPPRRVSLKKPSKEDLSLD